MIPPWLHVLSGFSLLLGCGAALVIVLHEMRHPQHMWIMNVVWPVTALFGSLLALWAYLAFGRLATHDKARLAMKRGEEPPSRRSIPFPVSVGIAATHCGSGCCIGDICAEGLALAVPAVTVAFGWQSLFAEKMFAVWILDYVLAFVLGIAFQYFTIKPMRNLSFAQGIVEAIKADALSLTAWQIGMYAFMAFAQFYVFKPRLGVRLDPATAAFWFMMQLAMVAGFITSYPVNWWLIRSGVKERM